ncbi:MAG: hypothetical protein AAGA77_10590 [Bacteroidota bacterium]
MLKKVWRFVFDECIFATPYGGIHTSVCVKRRGGGEEKRTIIDTTGRKDKEA